MVLRDARAAQSRLRMASASVAGLVFLMTTSGCGSTLGPVSSVKHDYNQPIRDTASWNWRVVSDDDYANVIAPVLGLDASSILPTNHALTQRAQLWIDRIDAYLRGTHADVYANVPKPQAKVLNNAQPNAFVAPVPACYNVPVQVAGGSTLNGGSPVSQIIVDVKSGTLAAWPQNTQCIDGTAGGQSAADTVASFVAHFNANTTNGCQFTVGTDGSLVANASCPLDPSLANVSGSTGLVLMQTANFVTVHSSIMTIMTEADFVSVLAHELGHFYRAHITASDTDYGYFYTLQPTEQPHKPTPEPALATLGQEATAASTVLDGSTYYAMVPGQKLRSDLYFTVGSLVAQAGSSSAACRSANKLIAGSAYQTAMGIFPFTQALSVAQTSSYQSFETQALACLATLSLRSDATNWTAVKNLAGSPTWPTWVTRLTPAGQQLVQSLNQQLAARLDDGTGEASATTVGDGLLAAAATLNAVDNQAVSILEQAHNQHLGQYTYEQEADDESGEWIADMGFNPETEVDAMHSLGKGMPATLHGEALGQDQCDVLWAQHWLDASGNYIYIPIGDFTDPHHSICYRMFNIERDVATHNEVAANVQVPAHDGSDWTALQQQAKGLSAPSLSAVKAPSTPVANMVKRTGALDCAYSSSYRH